MNNISSGINTRNGSLPRRDVNALRADLWVFAAGEERAHEPSVFLCLDLNFTIQPADRVRRAVRALDAQTCTAFLNASDERSIGVGLDHADECAAEVLSRA